MGPTTELISNTVKQFFLWLFILASSDNFIDCRTGIFKNNELYINMDIFAAISLSRKKIMK